MIYICSFVTNWSIATEQKMNGTTFYTAFAPLDDDSIPGYGRTEAIESLVQEGRYNESRVASIALIYMGLEGLRYLQT